MKIHHIGYAVRDISASKPHFLHLGFKEESRVDDYSRNVEIAFLRNGGTLVELIAPLNESAPVFEFLKKNGPMPYHIAYEVPYIEEAYKELKKDGWLMIIKPAAAVAINNTDVAFLFNKDVGIIELIEVNEQY